MQCGNAPREKLEKHTIDRSFGFATESTALNRMLHIVRRRRKADARRTP
jgi:hypothetical protein